MLGARRPGERLALAVCAGQYVCVLYVLRA
jgi:hypothetical protein